MAYEYKNDSPFFDQEAPQVELLGMISSDDCSEPYELGACAVFKAKQGWLVVEVSGCSCWPDRGWTSQSVCPRKTDVDKVLRGKWSGLLDACQAKDWKY
jgi:hypothetical protein